MERARRSQWEAAAQRVLGERPLDTLRREVAGGIALSPLHDERPAAIIGEVERSSLLSARAWQVRARIDAGTPAEVDRAIAAARRAGADAVELLPAWPGTAGARVVDGDGVTEALTDAHAAKLPVYVRAGALAGPWWLARSLAAEALGGPMLGGVLASPLGTLAADGNLPGSLDRCWDDLAAVVEDAATRAPELDLVLASALPAHDAGADVTTSLAFALAQLVATAEALAARGVSAERWLGRSWLELGHDGDVLRGIALVRAARACHARLLACLEIDASAFPARIHVTTTRTGHARHDPWTNLLRSNAEAAAAAIGGADAITLPTWDAGLGDADDAAQRLALTMQAVLQREGHLRRVADPAAGSYAVETLTDAIARKAWATLQRLVDGGGLAQALQSGALQREIASERSARERAIARRSEAVIGVSVSPDLSAPPPVQRGRALLEPHGAQVVDGVTDLFTARLALRTGSSLFALEASLAAGDGPIAACTPLMPFRAAADWEAQRESLLAEGSAAPRVLLACIGKLRSHKGRTDFARELLGAGGFTTIGGDADGFASPEAAATAFAGSGADLVALCGSDADYAEHAVAFARALARYAPRAVVLMGRPGDLEADLRAAGVDHFAYLGCDALALVSALSQQVNG